LFRLNRIASVAVGLTVLNLGVVGVASRGLLMLTGVGPPVLHHFAAALVDVLAAPGAL
jgi:hypothetical protein